MVTPVMMTPPALPLLFTLSFFFLGQVDTSCPVAAPEEEGLRQDGDVGGGTDNCNGGNDGDNDWGAFVEKPRETDDEKTSTPGELADISADAIVDNAATAGMADRKPADGIAGKNIDETVGGEKSYGNADDNVDEDADEEWSDFGDFEEAPMPTATTTPAAGEAEVTTSKPPPPAPPTSQQPQPPAPKDQNASQVDETAHGSPPVGLPTRATGAVSDAQAFSSTSTTGGWNAFVEEGGQGRDKGQGKGDGVEEMTGVDCEASSLKTAAGGVGLHTSSSRTISGGDVVHANAVSQFLSNIFKYYKTKNAEKEKACLFCGPSYLP